MFNPKKCKDMTVVFLHYNATELQPGSTDGKQIEVVTIFKLLEVYLSSDLIWSAHCEYIVKKAKRRLYALRKFKKIPVFVVVYCTVVRTIVEYASVVFANVSQATT